MNGRYLTLIFIIALVACLGGATAVQSQRRGERAGELREEFHQTHPLPPDGRVSLQNINGDVHIKVWDRQEVQIDAVKTARTPERLTEAEILVENSPDAVKVRTKYPEHMHWRREDGRENDNPAEVEYTLTVPRRSRLQNIELINGDFDAAGYAGDVRVSSINGRLTARGLTGEARLSTVNGALQVVCESLPSDKSINLSSVNGRVELTLPSDVNAEIRANTVHGAITNDFNLPVKRGQYVGSDLAGRLGSGASRIRISNVNGAVAVRRAGDGKAVSQAVSLLPAGEPDGAQRDEPLHREAIQHAMREAQRAEREVARHMQESQREMQRQMQREQRRMSIELREADRELKQVRPEIDAQRGDPRAIEKQTKSFAVPGATVPRVVVETFDGSINVRAWDKAEVSYTAVKKAFDPAALASIQLTAEQRGDEVYLAARRPPTANFQHGDHASVQFEVFVPRRANLRISSGDGRLSIDGVSGDIELKTGDGAIAVRNSGGRLRAETGDGRLQVAGFDGAAEVRTGDGRVLLEGRFTQLDAQTGDGPVSLKLPAGINATIETNAESVSNHQMYQPEDNNEEKRVRRWKLGGGGNVWKIRTNEGRVVLGRTGDDENAKEQ